LGDVDTTILDVAESDPDDIAAALTGIAGKEIGAPEASGEMSFRRGALLHRPWPVTTFGLVRFDGFSPQGVDMASLQCRGYAFENEIGDRVARTQASL
jgi:hypothetical protein